MRIAILACLMLTVSPAFVVAEEPTTVIALTPAGRERCLRVLRAGLQSKEFWPAMHAAEALTLAGHEDEVVVALAERMASVKDDQHRCGLAREMVRAGQRDRVSDMLAILAKPDVYAHTHAAESLYKVGEAGDGELLRKALKRDDLPKLQLMASAALLRAGDTSQLEFIRQRLADSSAENRQIAAWLLALVGDESDIPQLLTNAKSETDPVVRAYQEHALACLGNEYGIEKLEENLSSSDPLIRTYAAEFASHARLYKLAGILGAMLNDPHLDARIRAAQSLLVMSKEGEPAQKQPPEPPQQPEQQ